MESTRKNIDKLLIKTNINILQDIEREILKIDFDQNILKRTLLRKIHISIDEIDDEDLLQEIETRMQMPPLEEDDGDLQQKESKSERHLDAGNLLAEFLSASAVASERSAFQREFKIKGAIGEVGQKD